MQFSVARCFCISAEEARLAALISLRRQCPQPVVELIAQCLITAPCHEFFEAALAEDRAIVRRMLAWDDSLMHAVDIDGVLDLKCATALTHAVASGSSELVRFLVMARADVLAQSSLGNTALLVAADTGQTDAVEILLEGAASAAPHLLIHCNNFGQTALHWGAVAQSNAFDICELLLKASADPRSRCSEGCTAAHWATHPSGGLRGACGRAAKAECERVSRMLLHAEQQAQFLSMSC